MTQPRGHVVLSSQTKKMVSYTTTWDGDQMHVIGTGLPKPMEMRRSMRGGQMVMEMMYNGVTMTQYVAVCCHARCLPVVFGANAAGVCYAWSHPATMTRKRSEHK